MNYMQNLVVTQNCNCTIVILRNNNNNKRERKKRKSTGLNYWRGKCEGEMMLLVAEVFIVVTLVGESSINTVRL